MTEYVYKLKNGKVVSAYADEQGNISITKEALEIMANSWNDGYQKGYSDGHCKSRADEIKEVFKGIYEHFENHHIEVFGKDEVLDELILFVDEYYVYTKIKEQLREQKNANV